MAEIGQLPTTALAAILSFSLSCNNLNKHINGVIYEANWIIKSGEYRA